MWSAQLLNSSTNLTFQVFSDLVQLKKKRGNVNDERNSTDTAFVKQIVAHYRGDAGPGDLE